MFAHVTKKHIFLLEQNIVFALKKEFNSHRINLVLQYGGLFIVHSSNMADMTSCEHPLSARSHPKTSLSCWSSEKRVDPSLAFVLAERIGDR